MNAAVWTTDRWLADVADGLSALRELDAEIPTRLVYGADARGRLSFGLITRRAPDVPRMSSAVLVNRIRRDHDNSWLLLFTLEDDLFKDVFVRLCGQIYSEVKVEPSEETGFARALATIEEWRSLLKNDKRRLSIEQIRGVFAELYFVFDVLAPRLGAGAAVDAWQGPYGGDQDFDFPSVRYEIKSRRTTSRAVEIASEYQLTGNDIVLVVIEVTDSAVPFEYAVTLSGKLRAIRSLDALSGSTYESFEQALDELGVDLSDPYYDERFLHCGTVCYYEVAGEFPRITMDRIPDDVSGVRYRIDLDGLKNHRIEEHKALSALQNQD